jgi:hypothetical protein
LYKYGAVLGNIASIASYGYGWTRNGNWKEFISATEVKLQKARVDVKISTMKTMPNGLFFILFVSVARLFYAEEPHNTLMPLQ